MLGKIGLGLLWLGFVGYAFFLAPPATPDTVALITQLSTGQWSQINPLVVALFNLMGLWPLIYCGLLFADGRGQAVPAWPFASLSFAVGAFALLPYLVLRRPQPQFEGELDRWLRVWDSRWLGISLTVGAIALLGYGISQGDWADFAHQWQTSRFIHVMSLDFCLLSLLFPTLLGDDMARRQLHNRVLYWSVTLTPLLGPLLYLSLRPSLGTAHLRALPT